MPIFDQGYQHWQGQFSSRWWRWWTITRYGVRANFKSIWTKIVLFMALVPALLLAGAFALWGLVEQQSEVIQPLLTFLRLPQELLTGPKTFREPVWSALYSVFFSVQTFFCMILIVIVGPGLVSQDLRFNAMPLYFSRPLRRFDYFAGKLGVIGVFLAAVMIVPAVLAYLLGLLFSLDVRVLGDTYHLLLGGIAYGLIIVLSAGMFMLALSSLSRNSRYVSAFWVGIWIISNAVAGVLIEFQERENTRELQQLRAQVFRPGKFDPQHAVVAQKEIEEKMAALFQERLERMRSNWRPLLSYTGNLQRLGNQLLHTETAWIALGNVFDPGRMTGGRRLRGPSLPEVMAAQPPWQWSAAVLAALFGISLWVLTSRVKSLDRLR